MLIGANADVNAIENDKGDGVTPAFVSALRGRDATLRSLLRHGADVNAAERGGYTPVCIAAAEGHISTTELLVHHGADRALCTHDKRRQGGVALSHCTADESEVGPKYRLKLLQSARNALKRHLWHAFCHIATAAAASGCNPVYKGVPWGLCIH